MFRKVDDFLGVCELLKNVAMCTHSFEGGRESSNKKVSGAACTFYVCVSTVIIISRVLGCMSFYYDYRGL